MTTTLIIFGSVAAYVVITLGVARLFELDEIRHRRSDPKGSLIFGLLWPLMVPVCLACFAWQGGLKIISMPTRAQRRQANLEDMDQRRKDIERLERELGVCGEVRLQ